MTVNTRLALRIGGHRVTISKGTADAPAPVVRIDGQVEPLPNGSLPVGDGTLSRDASQQGWVTATWADGSFVAVRPVGKWGVAMTAQLASERAGAVTGLLGSFDGDPDNDLATRAGKRLSYDAKASDGWVGAQRFVADDEFDDAFFDGLYGPVADSWRISQADSLFDYGPGESTKTFTNKKLPTKPLSTDALRKQKRAEAEQVCRNAGVTEPGPLDDCILDVVATGDPVFAQDAKAAQDAASVSWRRLAGGGGLTGDLRLLRAGDGVLHIAFNRDQGDGVRQVADLPVDAAGNEGPEELIASTDAYVGLYAAADGGVRALTAELPADAPSGVYQYARDSAGNWTRLGIVTDVGTSYASRPLGLGLPGGGLLTVSPMAGVAQAFVGAPAAGEGVPFAVPEGCYASSPNVAADGATGAVWVAWWQWNCGSTGLFAVQVDPVTGAFLGTPQLAPGSAPTQIDLNDDVALSGRPGQPGVFLAYPAGDNADVALWQVGASDVVTFPRRKAAAGDVRLTAEPQTGRMWVVWDEGDRFWVQRTTPDATADGGSRAVAIPPNDTGDPYRLADLQASAGPAGLDLVYGLRRGDTPGVVYRARLAP